MEGTSQFKIYEFSEFRLDAARRLLYRKGEEVSLTPKAVETLLSLIDRRGEVVSKNELMEAIWPGRVVEESNLAQYLHLLRKALGKHPDGKPYIETLKRRGYRFNGEVKVSLGVEGLQRPRLADEAVEARDGSGSPLAATGRSLRVERHGNVLALLDWPETTRAIEQPASVPQPNRTLRSGISWPMAALGAAVIIAAMFVVWLSGPFGSRDREPKRDLVFLTLTNGEPLEFATISPDGNYFTYTSRDDELAHLWLQQTGQPNRTEIIPPFKGGIYGTTFAPDSKFIYYVAGEAIGTQNVLYRVPALGGVRTRILSDIASPVSTSPDGTELVFSRWNEQASNSSLVIASSDGMRERVLLSPPGNLVISTGGAWSPDGKSIAYGVVNTNDADGHYTITSTDLTGEVTEELSSEKWDTCFRLAWTRDGRGLVFNGTRYNEALSTRRDQIFYLSIANGESRRLTTDGSRHQYASVSLTDRDEILAVPFNRSSQIWAMDASGDSRTAVQITTGQADGRSGLEPMADGSISYLTRNGDGFSIWSVRSDGAGQRQLSTEPPAIEELRTAPNGQYYVFAAKPGRFSHLYRLDSAGADLKQLTFGETHEIDSDVSPDGKWILYSPTVLNKAYGKLGLWRVSSDGGEPVRFADVGCATPRYSRDGKFVSCISNNGAQILVLSIDEGKEIARFTANVNAVLNTGARWTPDGSALAYISFHDNASNVWLQPLNGNEAFRLTDFTSGDIYNFAFGVNDARLYLARGHSIRNAVLISNFK